MTNIKWCLSIWNRIFKRHANEKLNVSLYTNRFSWIHSFKLLDSRSYHLTAYNTFKVICWTTHTYIKTNLREPNEARTINKVSTKHRQIACISCHNTLVALFVVVHCQYRAGVRSVKFICLIRVIFIVWNFFVCKIKRKNNIIKSEKWHWHTSWLILRIQFFLPMHYGALHWH